MARRNDVLGVSGAETMIGSGVVVTGNLTSEGDILVDGTLTGDISAVGSVTVGINGVIKANIRADNVSVSGEVHGNITAEGEVAITESGQVRGNISAAGLAIASGGIFVGSNRINRTASTTVEPTEPTT